MAPGGGLTVRIIVAGALANKPRYGGEAWVRLAWALGLEALGFEVLFLEQLPAGARQGPAEGEYDPRVRFFEDVCEWSGLSGRAALVSV
ncbi:MAG TPA: hypothetical protein VLL48_02295, partial [Longimicrobiales bacterium]|nr:hypothetical protein [Longimicrobiales bacterium]